MRFIKTFVLRLVIDPDVPDLLCGDLQRPSDREVFPFKDKTELIALLHQLSVTAVQNQDSDTRRPFHESENVA